MVEDDLLLGSDLKQSMENNILQAPFVNPILSEQWPMVVIKDVDFSVSNKTTIENDFSVFPPSNHENLVPSPFSFDPPKNPSPPSLSPTSPLSPSSTSSFSSQSSDFSSPPSPKSLSRVTAWWGFSLQILGSKIVNLGSYFIGGDGKRTSWPLRNLGLIVMIVVWWLSMRVKRRRERRGETVGHLLQMIKEKDEKIIQLLNQIAQMNEVLLASHKLLTSKNG